MKKKLYIKVSYELILAQKFNFINKKFTSKLLKNWLILA